jgi:hypothetical protein
MCGHTKLHTFRLTVTTITAKAHQESRWQEHIHHIKQQGSATLLAQLLLFTIMIGPKN